VACVALKQESEGGQVYEMPTFRTCGSGTETTK
jgi:hypothetical protein